MAMRRIDPGDTFRSAFMALSPRARAVLYLCLVEDEDLDSVADSLGIAPSKADEEFQEAWESIARRLGIEGPHAADRLRNLIRRLPVPAPSPGFTERLSNLWPYGR